MVSDQRLQEQSPMLTSIAVFHNFRTRENVLIIDDHHLLTLWIKKNYY